jgi:hypothetical protein
VISLCDRSDWRGATFDGAEPWVWPLPAGVVEELEPVVAALAEARTSLAEVGPGRHRLPACQALAERVLDELEDGLGMVVLRGVPVERLTEDEVKYFGWVLLEHVGVPLYQNALGELIGEVRDETPVGTRATPVSELGGPRTRSYARSTSGLPFHTDRCDVVTLLCVRQGASGGDTKVVSTTAIYNEMVRTRPDLVAPLVAGIHRSPQGDDVRHGTAAFRFPIMAVIDEKITSQYSAAFLLEAQLMDDTPPWTSAEEEALALHARLAEELCVETVLAPGDIQLLNSHVTLHARTPYIDPAAAGRHRLLHRLWLAVPNSRRLPPGHDVLWGSVEPGSLRGGVMVPSGRISPFDVRPDAVLGRPGQVPT